MGIFDRIKTKIVCRELDKQIDRKDAERTQVNEMADLTPATYDGQKRRYHYKDVNIWVRWEYSGQYGKSCQSIGMKRGDTLWLLPPKEKGDDPRSIAIYWNRIEIGYMKSNRMRDMVHSWQAAKLPVLAVVSKVGGEEKLYIEFAFYGMPSKQ